MSGHRVLFLTGATATGKSDWALRLAEESGARIVNCDSVQIYRGLEIGSGLPTADERARVPHDLYAFVAPPREFTAGDYREAFFGLLKSHEPARWIVVGGTGFYFQAIEKGMYPTPDVPAEIHEHVRAELTLAGGPEKLWRELEALDPDTAERLHPSDHYRIARAVELVRSNVIPSKLRAEFAPEPFPYPLLKTNLRWPRESLRERIRARARHMIERGLRAETQGLLDAGFGDWAPLASVGYKEAVRAVREGLSDEWLVDEITLRTAQLAKRQETWFNRDPDAVRFDGASFAAFRDSTLRFFAEPGRIRP